MLVKHYVLQGAEDQQSLLLEQQAELSRLQTEARSSSLELQRLQRVLGNRDSELALLLQATGQLEQELEQLQQQKKKGDKTINVSDIATHTETLVNKEHNIFQNVKWGTYSSLSPCRICRIS